jgi:uncharacterized protein
VAVRISVAQTGAVLAERARWARTGKERRRGLLGLDSFPPGEALIIEKAPQVHTLGMAFPIDVVFADRSWKVRHVIRSMRPGRLSRFVRARYAVELPAGTVDESLTRGSQLVIDDGDGA